MRFYQNTAEIYVPDNLPIEAALTRTTHLTIAAHQDDIEMMAAHPILECYHQRDLWFTGVVMTDGRGSPRTDQYKDFSDEKMRRIRIHEQRKAATIGEYSALIMLDYPSTVLKDHAKRESIDDVASLLNVSMPKSVYTHNLADKHDTHVSVALKTIAAIRKLPKEKRPQKLYGCEVWRSLDWLFEEDKVKMNLSNRENLQMALLGVYDSQISGGKRYDQGTMGRRHANATFSESHSTDTATGLAYAMDMSPLIFDETINPLDFVQHLIDHFAQDVADRLKRLA